MANSNDGQISVLSVVGPLATSVAGLRLVFEGLLSMSPWFHDPMVHEIPWRHDKEKEVLDLIKASGSSKGKLAFGMLPHDGVVSPHPPVARAMKIVRKTLEKLGHSIVEWTPPSHQHMCDLVDETWICDGGRDVHQDFALSGEPLADQVSTTYGSEPFREYSATEMHRVNRDIREARKEYMDYWNSTAEYTGTGRPVDGFFMPLAPFAAARPKGYLYYGYRYLALSNLANCAIH